MNPTLISPPAVEPLTLADAKLHLKIDHADEDSYITGLIAAARRFCERYTRLALIDQSLKWTLNSWLQARRASGVDMYAVHPVVSGGPRFVEVPVGPLSAVISITVFDSNDQGTLWDSANYYISPAQNRIYRRSGVSWPRPGRAADGIEIVYTAGFGASSGDVPTPLRQGLLQLVAHLYVHREAVGEAPTSPVPFTITQMFDSYKTMRL